MEAVGTVQIQWSEVVTGHWRAVCQCGSEDVYEKPADRRVRLDPLDPKTSRHAGQCEFASETDAAVLKIVAIHSTVPVSPFRTTIMNGAADFVRMRFPNTVTLYFRAMISPFAVR